MGDIYDEAARLRQELRLAEEGLANYQQEVAARDQALKDLGYQLGEAEQELAHLRAYQQQMNDILKENERLHALLRQWQFDVGGASERLERETLEALE